MFWQGIKARRVLGCLAVAAALAASVTPARSDVVTYAFTGTVTVGDQIGGQLVGSFSIDTATPGAGHYVTGALFFFSIGARPGLTAVVDHIDLINNELSGSDRIEFGRTQPPGGGAYPTGFALFIELTDTTHTALTSNLLTDPLPPASAFDIAKFSFYELIVGIQASFSAGTIDSLVRVADAAVPEPSALLLLACACIAFAWHLRRPRTALAA